MSSGEANPHPNGGVGKFYSCPAGAGRYWRQPPGKKRFNQFGMNLAFSTKGPTARERQQRAPGSKKAGMKMTRLTLAGVAAGLVLAALSTQIAGAAPITRTFAFSASGFTPVIGSDPAPIASVSGSFTVTFDPAGGNVTNVTSGITGTVTPSLGSPIGFNYFPGSSLMDIGATVVGAGAIGVSADDFVLRILGPETASPTFGIFRYSRATDSTTYWGASQGSVTLATVAEPGTVAVLGLGLAGLCFTRRRRRTA